MRRIRTLTLAAGPKGVVPIGTILELPDDEAEARVKEHSAEYVEAAAEQPKPEPEIETATAEVPERAVTRERPQRRRTGSSS
jgi:hypothetical protein